MKKLELRLPPSAAHRWVECPGSAFLKSLHHLKSPSSEASEEGRLAHEVAARICKGTFDLKERKTSFNGASPEMVESAREYAKWLKWVCDLYDAGTISIEKRAVSFFSLPENDFFSRGVQESYIDFEATSANRKTKIIVDYKYGAGIEVGVLNNSQLQAYASIADVLPDRLVLGIYQPRVTSPVKLQIIEGRENVQELLKSFRERMKAAIERAFTPRAFRAGDHCRWCEAGDNGLCPLSGALAETGIPSRSLSSLSSDKLAEVLDKLDELKNLQGQALKELNRRLMGGETVPGWKLVESLGNREWSDPDEVLALLGDQALGEPPVLSPAKIERAKLLSREKLEALTFRPSRGPRVARDDDPRPPRDVTRGAFPDMSCPV